MYHTAQNGIALRLVPGESNSNWNKDDEERDEHEKNKEEVGPGCTECPSLVRCQVPNQTVLWGSRRTE